jgi:Zn-dependent protease with chaperone function
MELVYKNEKILHGILVVIGLVFWLAITVGTFGMVWFYMLLFFLAYIFSHSAFISHIKGNGVKLSVQQYPELYAQYKQCCKKLGVAKEPEVFIMNSDGMLNALATKFLRRKYVVLFSSIIDAMKSHPDGINFYIGHELGHITRGHLDWTLLIAPGTVLPLLGAAYYRAREYTCDLHGLHCCNERNDAVLALGVLASGSGYWNTLDAGCFMAQSKNTGEFWMSFHELTGDYPWLCKRMQHIVSVGEGNQAEFPKRSFWAGFFAFFVPRIGVGGGLANVMVVVAIIGILAAIALPAYQDYTIRAKLASAFLMGDEIKKNATPFIKQYGELPNSLSSINLPENYANDLVESVEITKDGFVMYISQPQQVAGKTLIFSPYYDEQKNIQWSCSGGTLEKKYRPVLCRE